MNLPIIHDQDQTVMMIQTKWTGIINPVLNLPPNQGRMLVNVQLKSGNNSINHGLGRPLQGWIVTRMIGSFVQLYDVQNTNNMDNLTLILNSSGNGAVNLWVF